MYLSKVIGESPNITYKLTNKSEDILVKPIEIIHSFRSNDQGNKSRILPHDYLFNLTELNTTADIFNWFKANKKMEPIVELYIEDLYNKQLSVSRRFLNMVQALEIYHSRMVCNGNLSHYKKRVKEIISDEPDDWKDKYRTFLLGDVYKDITLQQRLADLLLANFDIHFYTGDIEYYEFPKLVSKTRNYYIHYNPKLEDVALKGERLANAYRVLRVILEYYLLKELGFNARMFIFEKIKNRTTPIKTHIEVCRVNEKMYNKQ